MGSSSTQLAKQASRTAGGRAPGRILGSGAASIVLGLEPYGGDTVDEALEDRAVDARDHPDVGERREQRAAEEIAAPGGAEEEPQRPHLKALERSRLGRSTGVVEEPGMLGRALRFLRANWLFIAPLGVLALMLRLWYARSRDQQPRAATRRYELPDRLSPAEIGTLITNGVQTHDITATIADLAVRSHLAIEESDEGRLGLWLSEDFTVPEAGADDLGPHERAVPDGILFQRGDRVAPSDLKNEL